MYVIGVVFDSAGVITPLANVRRRAARQRRPSPNTACTSICSTPGSVAIAQPAEPFVESSEFVGVEKRHCDAKYDESFFTDIGVTFASVA